MDIVLYHLIKCKERQAFRVGMKHLFMITYLRCSRKADMVEWCGGCFVFPCYLHVPSNKGERLLYYLENCVLMCIPALLSCPHSNKDGRVIQL